MRLFKRLTAVILAAVTVCLCGCVGLVEQFYPDDSTDTTAAGFVPVDIEEGSIYFKDFDGNVITLSKAPDSVASLSAVATEIICGLGAARYITVQSEASSKLEGAPISAQIVPDYYADTDKIIELKPELVFYSSESLSILTVSVLQSAGITLVRIPEKGNIETAEANIRFISSLLYKDAAGERLIGTIRDEINKMKIAAEIVGVRKRVYIENPVAFSGIGGNTIVSELCAYAGADNVFSEKNATFYTNAKDVTAADPEAIIVLCDDVEKFNADAVRKREGIEDVYAVRTKAIYAIDRTTATRPTQNIIYALRSIGEVLKVTK